MDEEMPDHAGVDAPQREHALAAGAVGVAVDPVAAAAPTPARTAALQQPARAAELCDGVSPGALGPSLHAMGAMTDGGATAAAALGAVVGPRAARGVAVRAPRRAPTSGRSLLRLLAHSRLRGYGLARLLAWRRSAGGRRYSDV